MRRSIVAVLILSSMLGDIAYCEERSNVDSYIGGLLKGTIVGDFILEKAEKNVEEKIRSSFEKEAPEFVDVFIRKYHFYLERVKRESLLKKWKDIIWADLEKEAREDAKKDLASFFESHIVQIKSRNEQLDDQLQNQKEDFLTKSQAVISIVEEYEAKILEIDKQIYALSPQKNIKIGNGMNFVSGFRYLDFILSSPMYSPAELWIAKRLVESYSAEYKKGYAQWNRRLNIERRITEEQAKKLEQCKYVDGSILNEINTKMQKCVDEYTQKLSKLSQLSMGLEEVQRDSQGLMTLTESQLQRFYEQYIPPHYSKDIKDAVVKQEKEYAELSLDLKRNRNNIEKLHKFAIDTPEYLRLLDEEFENETSLSQNDYLLMCLAVAFQVARQNLVILVPSINDQKADKFVDKTFGLPKTASNRKYGYYNPTLAQVISNPVPYDVIRNSQGRLSGYGEGGHRSATLGHDSLLGLIVGTANIATGTVTTADLCSYHVTTISGVDAFGNRASTVKVFSHFVDKFVSKDIEDKEILAISFAKQLVHMLTDLPTKNSLPLPFVGLCDGLTKRWGNNPVGLGKKLSSIGAKTSRIVSAAGGAIAINHMIRWLHYGLCYDDGISEELFFVKSNKIVSYSNLVASAVNIGETIALENPKMADLGGYLVSVVEYVMSEKFARQIKRDFVFGKYDEALAKL